MWNRHPIRQGCINGVKNRCLSSSLMSNLPEKVKIVEVGPRDGLQNEAVAASTDDKITLITMLAEAGCSFIEAGSFVSPKWVPSMSDSKQVMDGLNAWRQDMHASPVFSCLVPNLKGLERALEVKADEIAIFGSASEAFSQKVGPVGTRDIVSFCRSSRVLTFRLLFSFTCHLTVQNRTSIAAWKSRLIVFKKSRTRPMN